MQDFESGTINHSDTSPLPPFVPGPSLKANGMTLYDSQCQ